MANLSYGLIDCTKGSVQKRLTYSEGKVTKDGAHFQAVSEGRFTDANTAGLEGFAVALTNIKPTQAITLGVCGLGDTQRLVTGSELAKLTNSEGTIARNKECLHWPSGDYLLLLDHDPEPGKPELTADQFWAELVSVQPELSSIGRVVTASTSSGIFDVRTGDCLKGEVGHHTYLAVRGDVTRFVELLKVRLWNSGKAFFKLATPNKQTGVPAILERFLLDFTVFSPERIIYEAGAICGEGIEQRRSEPRVYPGEVLDLDKLPDPTVDEIDNATQKRDLELEGIKPEQHKNSVKHYQAQGLPYRQAKNAADAAIKSQSAGKLAPGHLLHLKNGGTIAVRDLNQSHHGVECLDPQEPDYRGGAFVAKVYRIQDGAFVIHSFAHGGAKYFVQSDIEWIADQITTYDPKKEVEKLVPASKIAAAFVEVWGGRMAYNLESEQFMRYAVESDGLWSPQPDTLIRKAIQSALDATGIGYGDVVTTVVKLLTASLAVPRWQQVTDVTPMRNGVLKNSTLELMPHKPDNYLTWQLPYEYNPFANCQPIQDWLDFTQEGDQDRVQLLRAYLRAIVMGRSDLQRFLEVVSTVGGSGKSTFCNLAIALVGIENVHITDSNRLEQSRFETACFKGKRLIYFADAGRYSGDKAIDILKRITGGDALPYERKGKDSLAPFVCKAMTLIAANSPLVTTDTAIPRRRITVEFLKAIPQEQQRTLLELNTESETLSGEFEPCIPGLLNWVLSMSDADMVRYLKDTERAVPSLAAVKAKTLVAVNPMAHWLDTCCVLVPGVRTSVGNATKLRHTNKVDDDRSHAWDEYACADEWLYANYRQYCDRTGSTAVSTRRFSETLENLCADQLKQSTVRHGNDRYGSHFIGIAIRDDSHRDLPNPITGASEPTPEAQTATASVSSDNQPTSEQIATVGKHMHNYLTERASRESKDGLSSEVLAEKDNFVKRGDLQGAIAVMLPHVFPTRDFFTEVLGEELTIVFDWATERNQPEISTLKPNDRQAAERLVGLLKKASSKSEVERIWSETSLRVSDRTRAAVTNQLKEVEWGQPIIQQISASA